MRSTKTPAADTAGIQARIDEVAAGGGGTVSLRAGRYRCGTLHLRSNITLALEAGAVLVASPDDADFDPVEALPYHSHADVETTDFHFALLTGEGLTNIGIIGPGHIDANRSRRGGPKPIALRRCTNIAISDLMISDAPNYAVSLLGCDHVDIERVTVRNGWADGIDPDCCRWVRIANCDIDSYDDGICLKASLALGQRRATQHVVVEDCTVASSCNALKVGTETSGDVSHVVFRQCRLLGRPVPGLPIEFGEQGGVAIESVDGAIVEGVEVSEISLDGVGTPLFVRLGNRGRGLDPPRPGRLGNVVFRDIRASGATFTSSITGLPAAPVSDVRLEDLSLAHLGQGEVAPGAEVAEVPERPADYPQVRMFGPLPAYGLYLRHVERVSARRLSIGLDGVDRRPALVTEDVGWIDLEAFGAAEWEE